MSEKDYAVICELQAQVEQLRVQLAGCGVAAMCNTVQSREEQKCVEGAYSWSQSYQDVVNAVGREIELRDQNEQLRIDIEALRDEMKSIALALGRSKTDGESDCDWHDLAGDVKKVKPTIRRLIEMVGAAYTSGWMAGYSTGGTLDDESETNLDWHCGEDWGENGLRPELLKIAESV